jgi:hypothetical protein
VAAIQEQERRAEQFSRNMAQTGGPFDQIRRFPGLGKGIYVPPSLGPAIGRAYLSVCERLVPIRIMSRREQYPGRFRGVRFEGHRSVPDCDWI